MRNLLERLFVRGGHVCPWWCCFTFDNPLRRLVHNPRAILQPFVGRGDTAIDIGPGMGYFTIPLARMVGESGRVMAIDLQERMLRALEKRARQSGIAGRIETRRATPTTLGVSEREVADFVLAFWMVHEVPDKKGFLTEVFDLLKPGGRFLLTEPAVHVTGRMFDRTVASAKETGFIESVRPRVFFSRSTLFVKKVEHP